MKKAKFYGPEVTSVDFTYSKKVNLHIDTFDIRNIVKNEINILVLLEPVAIRGFFKYVPIQEIINKHRLFTYIITSIEEVLNSCNNARKFIYGHYSIDGEYNFHTKEFGISSLTGCKDVTAGHKLRLEYYKRQNEIRIPQKTYVSSRSKIKNNIYNNVLIGKEADSKMKLFDTMFHFCVENSVEKNYFTEKIIDCVQCKTVPVYFGCPNIGDFLNTNGIIEIGNNINDILDLINSLTPSVYDRMLPFIEENYTRSKNYINFPLRLKELVGEIIA